MHIRITHVGVRVLLEFALAQAVPALPGHVWFVQYHEPGFTRVLQLRPASDVYVQVSYGKGVSTNAGTPKRG